MDEPPPGGDERDRRETAGQVDDGSATEDDFYRGGGGVAVQSAQRRPQWWPGRFGAERPPAWLTLALAVVGVLVGFIAFSAAWDLAGDGLMAVPLATLAGVGAGVGTILVGGYAWTWSATATEPA